jgi:hypothetical protein
MKGKMRRLVTIAITVLLILLEMAMRAQCGSIDGVFALGVAGHPVPQDILLNPNIDGVALLFLWKELEPRERQFDWNFSDSEIIRAHAQGKKISLGVTPGVSTPEWVYGDGARKYTFLWDKRWGPPPCSPVSLPVPWDSVYIAKWLEFVRAFAQRYANDPDVVLVKIEGINAQTPEFFLPHSPSKSVSAGARVGCPGDDNLAAWQDVGYRPERVRAAWRTLAGGYAERFPNQSLVLETGPAGMPPIDDAGHIMPRSGADRTLAPAIISAGKSLIGARFVVQNDGLQVNLPWPDLLRIAPPASIAYQMAWRVTGDPSCRMNLFQRPCDPRSTLQTSINIGINSGAKYLEIYIADLMNPQLNEVIVDAHRRLTSKANKP